MNKSRYINKEFKTVVLGVLAFYVISLLGASANIVMAGKFLGETASAATEIILPIITAISGFGLLFSIGFQIEHSAALGRSDIKRAEDIFGISVTSDFIMSIFFSIFLFLFKDTYLTMSGCTGKLYELASEYYTYLPVAALFFPCGYIATALCENDGDTKPMIIGSISFVVVNVSLGLFLIRNIGMRGISISLTVGFLVQFLILYSHLFSKSSSIKKIKFSINLKEQYNMFKESFFSFVEYVFLTVVDIIIHIFILSNFDSGAITGYSVTNIFSSSLLILEAFTVTGTSIAGVYMGEGNTLGVKITVTRVLRALIMMGIVYTIIYSGFSLEVTNLFYSIDDPEVFELVRKSSYIMGLSTLANAVLLVPMMLFSCLGHPKYSVLFSLCFSGVFPLCLSIPMGLLFGYYGLVSGFALAPLATLIFVYAFIILKNGIKGFPLYLGEEKYKTNMYCFDTGDDLTKTLDLIQSDLDKETVSRDQSNHIRLLLEELIIKIRDNNNKKVDIECTTMINDSEIKMTVRDNGEYFDINEKDNKVNSMNSYLFPLLISRENTMKHVIVTSSNKNGFVFTKE